MAGEPPLCAVSPVNVEDVTVNVPTLPLPKALSMAPPPMLPKLSMKVDVDTLAVASPPSPPAFSIAPPGPELLELLSKVVALTTNVAWPVCPSREL